MKKPLIPVTAPASDPAPLRAFYCAEGYKPEDSFGHLMRQILNHVAHEVEHQLAHTDLTNAQWVPLFKLYTKQASTVAELARECHLDAGAMTRMLDRLEAKGLCKRIRSEADRRVVNLALTDAGALAAADIPSVLSGLQNAHLSGFTDDEFQMFLGFLRRILSSAQARAFSATHANSAPTPNNNGGPDAA